MAEEQTPNRDGAIESPKCFSIPTTKLHHWGTAGRYPLPPSPETMSDPPSLPGVTHRYGGDTPTSWDGHEVPLFPALAGTVGMLRQRAELLA